MSKLKAAGDEPDGWAARTIEEIKADGLSEALNVAREEIKNLSSAMIHEQGRDWTRYWYEIGLTDTSDLRDDPSLTEEQAVFLLKEAETNDDAFDLFLEFVASFISKGVPIPDAWRVRVVDELRGVRPRQGSTKRKKGRLNWVRDYMINHVARLLCDRYDISLTRNKETEGTAASDVVFYALRDSGFAEIGFGTVQNKIFDPERGEGGDLKSRLNYEVIRTLALEARFDNASE
ncbi:hypothetical protein [Solirhodobacter olei]|uniref:hypothetical protein n=1 Tax=Solirhodobacter olei TaxID=2493082 RepID=UPI000FD941CB|nr:hypothetical protein [Solirhodobacter olei]